MGLRRQAREAALQALFQCDFLGAWDIDAAEFCMQHYGAGEQCREFALKLCHGVISNLVKIDSQLTCASENWSLSRMARVDRAILRVATYEISYLDEVPSNVAINEAIEVAKRFGAEESPVFINGVLDRIASTLRKQLEVEDLTKKEADADSSSEKPALEDEDSGDLPENVS